MLTCVWHELAQVRSCAALALASVVKADPAAAASEVVSKLKPALY